MWLFQMLACVRARCPCASKSEVLAEMRVAPSPPQLHAVISRLQEACRQRLQDQLQQQSNQPAGAGAAKLSQAPLSGGGLAPVAGRRGGGGGGPGSSLYVAPVLGGGGGASTLLLPAFVHAPLPPPLSSSMSSAASSSVHPAVRPAQGQAPYEGGADASDATGDDGSRGGRGGLSASHGLPSHSPAAAAPAGRGGVVPGVGFRPDGAHTRPDASASLQQQQQPSRPAAAAPAPAVTASVIAGIGDLQRAGPAALQAAKARMEVLFEARKLKPGDPGYVYDKRVDFEPEEPSDWD